MVESFYMFWLLWILFIVVVFFMASDPRRKSYLVLLLMIISTSSLIVSISQIKIMTSFVIMLIWSLILIVENGFSLLRLLRGLSVMFIYCSLLLWEMIAPIWFVLSKDITIVITTLLFTFLLCNVNREGIGIIIFGFTFGHLLYNIILILFSLHYQIGTVSFFTHLSLAILFYCFIHTVIMVIRSLFTQMHHYILK